MLNILETVHNAGIIYNDLKFDNLLFGYGQKLPKDCQNNKNCFANMKFNLIDFGLAQSYINPKTGHHLEQDKEKYMRGNFLFGSIDQLSFYKTGRKDDLISLCYMMVAMLNKGMLPDLDLNKLKDMDVFTKLDHVKDYK